MCRNLRILLLAALLVAVLNFACGGGAPSAQIGQTSQAGSSTVAQAMQTPVLGFVYSPNGGEVRTINGVSGASTQGSSLALPEGITGISFAPGQKSAIVERSNGASLAVISFSDASPGALVPIPGAISQPNIVAFSPNGVSVALYAAAGELLQVVTGLPNQPQVSRTLGSSDLPDGAKALAIADDGVTLLEGTAQDALYLLSGGGPQLLENLSDLEGMSFNPKTSDALIFDRGGSTLSLLQNVSTLPASRQIAGGLTGLGGTVALQTNGRKAVITSTSANHLFEVDLKSLQVQELQLSTPPSMLTPMWTSGDYLLSWQPGQLAWIVDTNQPKGAVYWVPAAAPVQAAHAR